MGFNLIRNDAGALVIDSSSLTGANSVGIVPISQLPGSVTVQEALQSLATGAGSGGVSPLDLASNANGKGASTIGVEDIGDLFLETQVESVLEELALALNVVVADLATAQIAITTAQTTASTAESNAQIGIDDAAIAQTGINTSLATAASAQTAAEVAETDAQTGITNAATAQMTADTALADAAVAEANAQTGIANAFSAQATANGAETHAQTGITNAATAQSTANTALANAATAETDAQTAITNAATAQTTANSALTAANSALAGLNVILFSGVIVGGLGVTVSYLSNSGLAGAVNQITAFRFPVSARTMKRLRVNSISNTSINTVTCTLYKNGSATTMKVSIPAGTSAYTKFSDIAHPITFADGDDFDLRLDDAADTGALVVISASLEWSI